MDATWAKCLANDRQFLPLPSRPCKMRAVVQGACSKRQKITVREILCPQSYASIYLRVSRRARCHFLVGQQWPVAAVIRRRMAGPLSGHEVGAEP